MNKIEESELKKLFLLDEIDNSWKEFFENYISDKEIKELLEKVKKEYEKNICWPKINNIFRIFREISIYKIKVIILGQDPYYLPNVADGFSFSTEKNNFIPKTLKNIFLELKNDLGYDQPKTGSLINWIKEGVFLINSSLSVIENNPLSHIKIWLNFSKKIVNYINLVKKEKIIWIIWGEKSKKIIEENENLIINKKNIIFTSHPSPYSANISFFGSRVFSKINKLLKEKKIKEINWKL